MGMPKGRYAGKVSRRDKTICVIFGDFRGVPAAVRRIPDSGSTLEQCRSAGCHHAAHQRDGAMREPGHGDLPDP